MTKPYQTHDGFIYFNKWLGPQKTKSPPYTLLGSPPDFILRGPNHLWLQFGYRFIFYSLVTLKSGLRPLKTKSPPYTLLGSPPDFVLRGLNPLFKGIKLSCI